MRIPPGFPPPSRRQQTASGGSTWQVIPSPTQVRLGRFMRVHFPSPAIHPSTGTEAFTLPPSLSRVINLVLEAYGGGTSVTGASSSSTLILNADESYQLTGSTSAVTKTRESIASLGAYGGGETGTWHHGTYSLTLTRRAVYEALHRLYL